MTGQRAVGSAFSLLRPYRAKLVVGIALLIAASGVAITIPWLLGRAVEVIEHGGPQRQLSALALSIIALAIVHALIRTLSRATVLSVSRHAEHDLRMSLFEHLIHMDVGFFRNRPTGDLMSRLTSDMLSVRSMWSMAILHVINIVFAFAFALAAMIVIDPRVTFWALIPFPLIVLVGAAFKRLMGRTSLDLRAQVGRLSATLHEDFAGIAVIKTFGLQRLRAQNFADSARRLVAAGMKEARLWTMLVPLFGFLATCGTMAVIWGGARAVIAGRISLGQLVQIIGYLALLVSPTLLIGWVVSSVQQGLAAWNRIRELLDTQPRFAAALGPPVDLGTVSGEVAIRNLTVRIDGRTVLDDVSLTLPAGSITAIVGRVGSGKSTLVEAIARVIDVAPGTILLDGRDVVDIPLPSFRRCIGYAAQEAFLFSTSIADNIAIGVDRDRDRDASPRAERLDSYAAAAGLTRDLATLPDAADTIVGERGVMLSGGQRQRVALARALAASSRLLILDDSISSVDAETERTILDHLDAMMQGRTTILISHRLAAVTRADQIVVLDGGRVAAVGTHAQLLADSAIYADLYRRQLAEALIQ